MISETSAPKPAATTAPCPKCGTTMVLATITPHPVAPQMQRQRHTFLCAKCNQTKTYMLKVSEDTTHNATSESKEAPLDGAPIGVFDASSFSGHRS